ncbi:Hypothetical predicted protein [Mytilus galloprovincialis]|uniref:Uncharacterized protein n=1 Tax=Mytilus galloprovincialis TaxID=29158 RepID=A0A8B6BSL2_MYTGA|nr:Hypothetical predicted protein [Mytilus galloprovincialis]
MDSFRYESDKVMLDLSNYEYLCPTALNWQIRSTALCTSTDKYNCLHDENTDTLREICRESPSMLAAGNRYVIRGNLDGEYCNENRYQPFIFQTNKDNECAIQKSNCDEAGQIIYSNGSTTEDKSCRCDYSKSYAPIKKPSNPCYCVPSKEDCSCYLKLCPEKTHLSSEYICVSDYTLVTLDECGQIQLTRFVFINNYKCGKKLVRTSRCETVSQPATQAEVAENPNVSSNSPISPLALVAIFNADSVQDLDLDY